MSEDLVFRIQLGVILPKLKETIAADLGKIIEELVGILQAGTRGGEELEIEPIKQIVMQDLEILLDDAILPDIEQKLKPPEEAAEEEEEEAAEEEEEEAAEEEE
jgi:hypothetical protein